MDRVDHHSLVGEALMPLIDGLSPFVAKVLTPIVPPGTQWPDLLRAKDAANGRRGGEYRTHDLSLMLRAMTERLGNAGYPFFIIYLAVLRTTCGSCVRSATNGRTTRNSPPSRRIGLWTLPSFCCPRSAPMTRLPGSHSSRRRCRR